MPGHSTTDREPDDELVRRTSAGDTEAFAALYRRRHADVFRFAVHMTGSPVAAEDVTQDVFMAVMRDAARYQAGRSSVAAWLCGIARNHVLRRLDNERRLQPLASPDGTGPEESVAAPEPDPVGAMIRLEQMDALRRAIQTLPVPYREAVVLCDLQEMPYADAAAVLSCAIGTVRSRLHRARNLLAAKLTALSDGRAEDSATGRPGIAKRKLERGGCVA